MAKLLDLGLMGLINGYELRVAPDNDMGDAEAVTDLNKPVITFGATAYAALYRGEPRARMTGAHELGHLMMHSQQAVGLAFMKNDDPLVDPERQADVFAAAFLMPEAAFRRMTSIDEAMRYFGVSRDAATCRARKLRMNWLVIGRRPPIVRTSAKKKGRKSMTRTP